MTRRQARKILARDRFRWGTSYRKTTHDRAMCKIGRDLRRAVRAGWAPASYPQQDNLLGILGQMGERTWVGMDRGHASESAVVIVHVDADGKVTYLSADDA